MGLFSKILPFAGMAAGGYFGGPMGAAIGGGIGSALGGNKPAVNTQQQTQQYLEKIGPIGKQYYEPYIGPGMEAGNRANAEYSGMLDDPTGFLDSILKSYKPSEGYNFKEQHLRRGAANTAAAGGFSGTQFDTENQTGLVNALLSDDMQQYLNNVLGIHGTGLAGKEKVAGRGYDASSALADFLGSNLSQQGGLAFHGAENRNARQDSLTNALMTLGGNAFGYGYGKSGGAPPGGGGAYKTTAPGAAWM